SLGVTCMWFVWTPIIADLVRCIPQLETLTIGECVPTRQSDLSARLALFRSLRTLTFVAHAVDKEVFNRHWCFDDLVADFVTTAASSCLMLQQLTFVAFARRTMPQQMNLCALGNLVYL